MNNPTMIQLGTTRSSQRFDPTRGKILLVKPPYFTPWTPPLGISILKSFVEQNGYPATCHDYNTDSELWGMHHKYFAVLQAHEDVSMNDGYSKLWWILNAHMLAYANGADTDTCSRVLKKVISLYGVKYDATVITDLIALVDGFYKRLDELTHRIDLSKYAVVGTSTYTTSLGPSLFILKKAKREYPHILTVMGGGVFADDLALGSDNLTTLIEEYPYLDHVILGEGEMLFLKLLEGELSHKRVISIADLEGKTLDMKDVPIPDFSDLNSENYYHLTIEGARSCPFQCSFCSETIQWGDYRKKPVDLFADQVIDLAKKFNNNTFFMGDSLMNPYIMHFSSTLLEKKANILYDGYLRADKPVTYRDKVKTWADSGCYRVRLGIESAAENILKAMDKMTTPKVISDVLKTLSNAGIRTTTYWIVGFPGETEEDFQETYDFIKEHHRYIYELEAHPYYYYPYGQVGSRLHQCYSLYPEDVTDVTKFKVWEIIGANPSREERYDRLNRISKLAASLGLPNIYKMEQRYQAEDRWLRLYPLAVEVYKGTQLSRKPVRLPDRPIPLFSTNQPGAGASDVRSVLCYEVRVSQRLDEMVLSTSMERLIENNEMLQMGLRDGQYFSMTDEEAGKQELLSAHRFDGASEAELAEIKKGIVEQLSAEIRPARAESVRAALISVKGESSLLFFAHRAIADAKSVVLLVEDLFRIYEQLSNGKQMSLRPVKKSYADFMNELSARRGPAEEILENKALVDPYAAGANVTNFGGRPESDSKVISLLVNRNLAERLTSPTLAKHDLRATEIFIVALLRSLNEYENLMIDLKIDLRMIEITLEETVGLLTGTYQLPDGFGKNARPLSNLKQVGSVLRDLFLSNLESKAIRADGDAGEKRRVLFNMEYFTEGPWLGGDLWNPEGFLLYEGSPQGEHLLEIMPVLTGEGIQVYLKHQADPDVSRIVETIINNLGSDTEIVVTECEQYIAAKNFWLSEFADYTPQSNIDVDVENKALGRGRGSIRFKVSESLLNDLQSKCDVDSSIVALSAFAILLSRLSGREDVVIVFYDITSARLVPVRLRPYWTLSYRDFAQELSRKISLATENSPYAFDILMRELPKRDNDSSLPIFDVAYKFGEPSEAGDIEEIFEENGVNSNGITLALEAVSDSLGLNMQLAHERGCFSQDLIEKTRSYLISILEEASRNVDSSIGEIRIENQQAGSEKLEALTSEVFNF